MAESAKDDPKAQEKQRTQALLNMAEEPVKIRAMLATIAAKIK